MRSRYRIWLGAAVVAPGLLLGVVRADEPKGLSRLFRFGGSSSQPEKPKDSPAEPLPSAAFQPSSAFGSTGPLPGGPAPAFPASNSAAATPYPAAPPAGPAAAPRITPQPRTSRGFTESDPLVTRVTLGRSDNGQQFAMFLQVFADGTVVDGEGVHRVGRDALKPLVDLIATGEMGRVKGHCGGPSTDYVEQVHVTVFERNLGRLRANSFSYSGNTQGCDHAVRHLQTALDAIQAKISPAMASSAPVESYPATTPAAGSVPPYSAPLGAPPLPLTSTP